MPSSHDATTAKPSFVILTARGRSCAGSTALEIDRVRSRLSGDDVLSPMTADRRIATFSGHFLTLCTHSVLSLAALLRCAHFVAV